MTNDERNFRSYYYEKVGFRGVEEKRSLEILLKEKPLDVMKLRQFCLRFPVPAVHRSLVWKIIFGILPSYTDSHQWIWEQRLMQFTDLQHALEVMGHISAKTPKSTKMLLMWLIEQRNLHYDYRQQIQQNYNKRQLAVIESLLELFDDEVECYWLAKGFFKFLVKFDEGQAKLKDLLKMRLEVDDPALYKHLISMEAVEHLPLQQWFGQCFAGCIDETSLVRIWDKLVGGSCQIVIFLALALLIHCRRSILCSKTIEEIVKCLGNVTKESADVVVNKAVELWQQHGGPTAINLAESSKQR